MSSPTARFSVPFGTKRRLIYLLIVGLLVLVIPISFDYSFLRPELIPLWVFLIAYIYSYKMSLALVLLIGLIQGIIEGAIWGAHALALIFIAMSTVNVSRRLRGGSMAQRLAWVFLMVAAQQGLLSWISLMADLPSLSVSEIIVPALLTACLWLPISRWFRLE